MDVAAYPQAVHRFLLRLQVPARETIWRELHPAAEDVLMSRAHIELTPVQRQHCVGQIFAASALRQHVSPAIEFPRPAGVLAARLQQTRIEGAPLPCTNCEGTCDIRRYVETRS